MFWTYREELKVFTNLPSWFNSNLLLSRSIHKHSFLWFPFPSILQSTLHISLFHKWSSNKIARCLCWSNQKKKKFRRFLFCAFSYRRISRAPIENPTSSIFFSIIWSRVSFDNLSGRRKKKWDMNHVLHVYASLKSKIGKTWLHG